MLPWILGYLIIGVIFWLCVEKSTKEYIYEVVRKEPIVILSVEQAAIIAYSVVFFLTVVLWPYSLIKFCIYGHILKKK
jgi:hypothetical protein